MARRDRIGIVAPSAVVPRPEFDLGLERLKEAGVSARVHPQCRKRQLFFAGDDDLRAQAFYDFAVDDSLPVIWCARGGYGAIRVIPYLEKMTAERGIPPKKLLVGYSDAIGLAEFVRTRWNWATLHAPMPGLRDFAGLSGPELGHILNYVRAERSGNWKHPAGKTKLKFFGASPRRAIEAPLVGGNLSVWASLAGTPFFPRARGRILFLEDVGEGLYRIDRMVQQLLLAGAFEQVKALILGTWYACDDKVARVLKKTPVGKSKTRILRGKGPKPGELGLLRPEIPLDKGLQAIFGELGHRLGIPVAYGLPVGHGPSGHCPLPLGADFRLTPQGGLELLDWDWFSGERL